MDTLDEALRARIDELAGSDKGRQPILSTTGTQVAIAEPSRGMTGSSGRSAS